MIFLVILVWVANLLVTPGYSYYLKSNHQHLPIRNHFKKSAAQILSTILILANPSDAYSASHGESSFHPSASHGESSFHPSARVTSSYHPSSSSYRASSSPALLRPSPSFESSPTIGRSASSPARSKSTSSSVQTGGTSFAPSRSKSKSISKTGSGNSAVESSNSGSVTTGRRSYVYHNPYQYSSTYHRSKKIMPSRPYIVTAPTTDTDTTDTEDVGATTTVVTEAQAEEKRENFLNLLSIWSLVMIYSLLFDLLLIADRNVGDTKYSFFVSYFLFACFITHCTVSLYG